MKVLSASATLRARVALRPRSTVLVDRHGELCAEELLDLVRLHRRRRRTRALPLAELPPTAPLRQVLVTALAGNGTLEVRSSGTTGPPRLQRRGPLSPAQLLTLGDLARRIGLRPGRSIASLVPGVRAQGLLVALGALGLGAPLVDLSHLTGPERVALLHRSSPDLLTGLPVHLEDLLRAEQMLGRERPLRIPRVISGSDVLSPALRADLARRVRARVHDVYGTTEAGPLTVDDQPLRRVRLREVGGLLRARTPFTGGRELVTDRGEIGEDGAVRVLGRADAAAAAAGMLHDPVEVVRVLCTHRGVDQVTVRMVPDEHLGVHTVAEVELHIDEEQETVAPTPESLQALVHDRLGAAAVPREVLLSSPGRPPAPR